MKLYVGNLPFSASEDEIREAFEAFGDVEDVAMIMDRETGRPRGFAFVTMADDQGGQAAIEAMNDANMGGRPLKVNEARPREERGGGGYRGGGGGGYRGGGGGGNRGGGGGGYRDRGGW
jgi:RNA recognition motif-containing protein